MTKAEKIKICREFILGDSYVGLLSVFDVGDDRMKEISVLDIEKALRWGLKHPEELRRGNK